MLSVLFVCTHNAGRSQIAAGFLKTKMPQIEVFSAGEDPKQDLNPLAIESMREIGIDISEQSPSKLTDSDIEKADIIIRVGCQCSDSNEYEVCNNPGKFRVWDLETKRFGQDLQDVRVIRNEIEGLVNQLVTEIV